MTLCFHCKTEITDLKPGRGATCDKCSSDIHCCHNCGFYDRNSYNECREPQAERVVDKEKRNFCDYFTLSSNSKGAKEKVDSKKLLDDLFK